MVKKKMVARYAADKNKQYDNRGRITEAKIRCAGCGKWIDMNGDLADVQISVTKRGTGVFFHTGCMGRVWKSKIATA